MKLSDKRRDDMMLLKIAILGLLEQDKMHVDDVIALTKKTVEDIWIGLLRSEEHKARG